jgi:hypothetical protein
MHHSTAVSLVLLALLLGIAAFVAGIVVVVLRGLEFFRTTRDFSGALAIELEVLSNSLERLNSFQQPDTAAVATAFGRLESSRQRLEILTGALGRVQRQWAGLFAVYPRK